MRRSVSARDEGFEDAEKFDGGRVARTVGATALITVVAMLLVGLGFFIGRWAVGSIATQPAPVIAALPSGGAVPSSVPSSTRAAVVAKGSSETAPGDVEIPDVAGMRVDEALVLLQASGLNVVVTAEQTAAVTAGNRRVSAQTPRAGTVASGDSTVTLVAPPLKPASASIEATSKAPASLVVCIDPGHQAHNDQKLEPIGPGSKTMRPRATGGGTGVATGVPEYELALQISVNLKRRLESQGVRVVLTRSTNDVDVSNAERARKANAAHASLFIRIHCGGSTVATDAGMRTLYPASNVWTAPIVARSRAAARLIEGAACRTSHARMLGAHSCKGVIGFNWSKVPAVMVEAGYLSNPIEDRLLASPAYQDRLVGGITDGVLAFLHSQAAQ